MFLEFSDKSGNLTVVKTYLSTKGQTTFTFVGIDKVEGSPIGEVEAIIGQEMNKYQINEICVKYGFKCQRRSGDELETFFDEVPVIKPTDLQVTEITSESATASWESADDEKMYDVAFGESGLTPEDSFTRTSDKIIDMVGLDPETEYDVYVRAVKSSTNKSDWVGPTTFSTIAAE